MSPPPLTVIHCAQIRKADLGSVVVLGGPYSSTCISMMIELHGKRSLSAGSWLLLQPLYMYYDSFQINCEIKHMAKIMINKRKIGYKDKA